LGLGLGHAFVYDDPSLSTYSDDAEMEDLGSVSAKKVLRMTLDDLENPIYLEKPRWVGGPG